MTTAWLAQKAVEGNPSDELSWQAKGLAIVILDQKTAEGKISRKLSWKINREEGKKRVYVCTSTIILLAQKATEGRTSRELRPGK